MIDNIKIEKINNNKYLMVIYLEDSSVTSGVYLSKQELYSFYTKIR